METALANTGYLEVDKIYTFTLYRGKGKMAEVVDTYEWAAIEKIVHFTKIHLQDGSINIVRKVRNAKPKV